LFDMAEIDQQHRKLVKLLKKMNEAVKSHKPRKEIYRIFEEVISYTELHFATEERVMTQTEFPETKMHKKHHKQLLNEAHLFMERLDDIGEHIFREWFNQWYYACVVTHLLHQDRRLEDHISQLN